MFSNKETLTEFGSRSTIRFTKGRLSGQRKIILDGNSKLWEEIRSATNNKYV